MKFRPPLHSAEQIVPFLILPLTDPCLPFLSFPREVLYERFFIIPAPFRFQASIPGQRLCFFSFFFLEFHRLPFFLPQDLLFCSPSDRP